MMRRGILLGVVALIGAFVGLYNLKYAVAQREAELAKLDRALADSTEAIHVLRAEWAYLNQPQRLAALAERHLDLAPMDGIRIATLDSIVGPRAAAVSVALADLGWRSGQVYEHAR